MTTVSSVKALQRPKWWLLSLLIPLMGGMMFWQHRLKLSAFWHQFFGVAMILLVYGLMGVWLWLNADYFDNEPTRSAHESAYGAIESIPLSLMEEGKSIVVYTVDENGQIIEGDQEGEAWVRLPNSSNDDHAEFDIDVTIGAIEAELQAEYAKSHSHHF